MDSVKSEIINEKPKIELYLGDCLEIMKTIPDKSIDLVLTDPPYGINIGSSGKIGDSGYVKVTNYAPVVWDDKPLSAEQFEEMKRIGKEQIIFGFNNFMDILPPSRNIIVWDKKCKNDWDDNFSDCELAWVSKDGLPKIFRHLWMGALRGSEKEAGNRRHPTQKPIVVMKWIINKYSEQNQTILDPFMGSGTTLVAAKELGRNAIGIEIEPKYYEIAKRRIMNATTEMFVK